MWQWIWYLIYFSYLELSSLIDFTWNHYTKYLILLFVANRSFFMTFVYFSRPVMTLATPNSNARYFILKRWVCFSARLKTYLFTLSVKSNKVPLIELGTHISWNQRFCSFFSTSLSRNFFQYYLITSLFSLFFLRIPIFYVAK